MSKIFLTSLFFCLLYFIYSIFVSGYDFVNMKHQVWKHAENRSTVYSSRRSTTVTYNFKKEDVRISRKYPGILEGINTWMWGIDKKAPLQNLSFYLREKDYIKVKTNQIEYKQDILGNKLNEIKAVPFFGLREMSSKPNKLLLALDIWKYNYSILAAFVLLISPYLIILVVKKVFKISLEKNHDKNLESKIGGYMILFFVLLVINLIV